MGSVKSILIGWGKSLGYLPTSEAEKKLSELRLSICEHCPFSTTSTVLEIVKGNADYLNVLKCTKCGCPCKEKSLVVSESCPINKW